MKKGSRKYVELLAILIILSGFGSGCTHPHVEAQSNAPLVQPRLLRGTIEPENVVNLPYDTELAIAVRRRWQFLGTKLGNEVRPKLGKVTVEFKLFSDGKVTDANILRNEVGEPLDKICKQAIIESAPFPPWPSDMQKTQTMNYRVMLFTFRYR